MEIMLRFTWAGRIKTTVNYQLAACSTTDLALRCFLSPFCHAVHVWRLIHSFLANLALLTLIYQ
jgi:hypothetical protein